jgi:hypothetical protein
MKPWQEEAIKELGSGVPGAPVVLWNEDGVPCCTREQCPAYDGKRCELTGFRPDGLCEPVVSAMAGLLED